MRVGLYNRWLATLGGGEKLGLSVAEYISQYHTVTVISHKPVSREVAAERLSLDLSRVEFKFIPERLATEMTPVTAEYDFFITSSFLDYFPSSAPISALLVYFPSPIDVEPIMHMRRRLKFALRHWLMIPSFYEGVYNIESHSGSQIRWITSSPKVRLPGLRRDYTCQFDMATRNEKIHHVAVSLDGGTKRRVELPEDQSYIHFALTIPGTGDNFQHELTIHLPTEDNNTNESQVKLYLANFQINHPRYRIYQIIFERWMRSYGMRLHYVPPGLFSILESLDTYNSIWAISDFSHKWIKKYWDRPSEILTPPINIEDFHKGEKRQQILSVGRFFSGSHNKKHLALITAYKNMVAEGLQGWELHLVGGTTPGLEHSDYLQRIRQEAQGYPIKLHIDIPFKELVQLYSESAIYWHASGFGENEEREPIKFEHFGITTVEAMASGCVPVVIGMGGQPEIVQHGQNGFLWLKLEELQSLTWKLICDPDLYLRLSNAAFVVSQRYGKANFNILLGRLLEKIGVPTD